MHDFYPHSYNGFLFTQENRVHSSFEDPYDWNISGIQTRSAERQNARPKYTGTSLTGTVKVVNVYLSNPDKDRDDLVIAMDAGSNVQRRFYVKDKLGNLWYVNAKATRLSMIGTDASGKSNDTEFSLVLDIDNPVYVTEKEFEDTWNITLDEETHTVIVAGNQETYPEFTITAGTPVGYYPFSYFIKNVNPIAAQQTDGIDITNGGWDTEALIDLGNMLANGDDVRVFMDGAEIPRWFGGGGIDSATTKVFIRAVWKPGPTPASVKLRVALDNVTTPAKVFFQVTAASKASLSKWPVASTIRIGNEEISYRALNSTLCEAVVVSRNIRGTTIASHSVGDNVFWIEHDIRLVWGDAAAEAPVYDERFKPQFDLDTSTNSLRDLTTSTGFADTAGLRAGAFIRQVLNDGLGKLNRVYSDTHGAAEDVDPAVVMGMEIASYEVQGKAKPETAELAWRFDHPAGITHVTTDAEKFKSFADTKWPVTMNCELQYSTDGVKFIRKWNEVIPAVANTYTAITNNTQQALVANVKSIRYRLQGSINGVLQNFIRFEVNEVTIQLNSSNVIQTGFNGSEEANYQFAIEIRNGRTEESIFVDYPAAEGIPLVINTGEYSAVYKGLNAIRAVSWDSIRTYWMRMLPGDNPLTYISSSPTGAIQIKTKTRNRAM